MQSLEKLRGMERKQEFQTPFCNVMLKEFSEAFPENKDAMREVMKEIDTQAVNNFGTFTLKKEDYPEGTRFESPDGTPQQFPGTSFTVSKLTITPELIERLAGKKFDIPSPEEGLAQDEEGRPKNRDYFLFTAAALPPDGHALSVADVAIDRFIRLIPRVANAMQRGETPPQINMYLLGAPTGLGGTVTPELVQAMQKNGLDPYGKLYAKFIEKYAGDTDSRVILQGVSKGAAVVQHTSNYLPPRLFKRTQRLLDNPVGERENSWFGGAQIAAGVAGELGARLATKKMRTVMKQGGKLIQSLKKQKGIPEETPEQAKLKQGALFAELRALGSGSPLDTNMRSFVRRGIYDPLTFSPTRLAQTVGKSVANMFREKSRPQFYSEGRVMEAPFKGNHFFFYNRLKRWNAALGFAKNTSQ